MDGSTDLLNQIITTVFGGFVIALGVFTARMINTQILTEEQPKEIRSLLKGMMYFIYFICLVSLVTMVRRFGI